MSQHLSIARRFLLIKLLRSSLIAGALIDLAVATTLAFSADHLLQILSVSPPEPAFYRWIAAVLLLTFAGFSMLAAYDVRRYSGVLLLVILGRLAIAVTLIAMSRSHPGLSLASLAIPDLTLGALHTLFWLPVRS